MSSRQKVSLHLRNEDDSKTESQDQEQFVFDDSVALKLAGSKIDVRCQDRCPWGIRHLIYFNLFVISIYIDIVLLVPLFTWITIMAYIDRYIFCECFGCNICGCGYRRKGNTRTHIKSTFIPSHLNASILCCFTPTTARYFGRLRLALLPHMASNSIIIDICSKIVGMYQVFEFFVYAAKGSSINSGNSYILSLMNSFANEFGTDEEHYYVPFMFGIGSPRHETAKKIILSRDSIKSTNTFSMDVPQTTLLYDPLAGITSTTGTRTHQNSRAIMKAWLSVFHNARNISNRQRMIVNHLKTILPSNKDISLMDIKKATVNAWFYVLMGNEFTPKELEAVTFFVDTGVAFLIMPSYMHFFLGGFYFERQVQSRIEAVRAAFVKNMNTQSIKAVYDKAQELGVAPDVALRNIVVTFLLVAGASIPTLACVVASRIKQDPDEYIPLYLSNKDNFIKECARLDPPVTGITTLLKQDEQIEIAGIKRNIPKGTVLNSFIATANRDPKVFGGPDRDQKYANSFDPKRPNLDKLLTWSSLEQYFTNDTVQRKAPRYCPGHNFALFLVKAVTDNYVQDFRILKRYRYTESMDQDIDTTKMKMYEDQLDTTTKGVVYGARTFLETWNPLSNKDVKIPTQRQHKLKKRDVFGIKIPINDEDLKDDFQDFAQNKLAEAITLPFVPMKDQSIEFETAMDGYKLRKYIFGDLWPLLNVDWNDSQNGIITDDANSLFVFYGIGLWITSRVDPNKTEQYTPKDAYWMCDTRVLGQFPTRNEDEMERLGAAAYFNKNRKLIGIYVCADNKYFDATETHRSNPFKWLHVKWLFRCSVGVKMTLDEHLLKCHLSEAAALDICCREQLPPKHPLRRFFKPFIYRTTYVNNNAANILVSENGLIHRGFCYTYETMGEIMAALAKNRKFETVPQHFKANGITDAFKDDKDADIKCPPYKDTMRLWNINHSLIKKYIAIYYKTEQELLNDKYVVKFMKQMHGLLGIKRDDASRNFDALLLELTELLTAIAGLHEYLGNFVEYKIRPDMYCGVVRYNKNMADIHAYAYLLALGAFTGPKCPQLLGEFTHVLLDDVKKTETHQLFDEWQSDLRNLSKQITKLNSNKRIQPFNGCNPIFLEVSVSI